MGFDKRPDLCYDRSMDAKFSNFNPERAAHIGVEGEFIASFFDEYGNLVDQQKHFNRILNRGLAQLIFGVFGGATKAASGAGFPVPAIRQYLHFGLGLSTDSPTADSDWFDGTGLATSVRVNTNASLVIENNIAVLNTGDMTFPAAQSRNSQRFRQAGLFLSEAAAIPNYPLAAAGTNLLFNLYNADYDNSQGGEFTISGQIRIGAL